MSKRILILSHDNKIGDAIVATGLFRHLRSLWPDCEIGVLCGTNNAPLYRFHPDVKWLHVSKSRNVFVRIWAGLHARIKRYDLVVHFGLDLANSSTKIILDVVNAKQRYLFAKHPTRPHSNDVVIHGDWPQLHFSARHLNFLNTLGASVSKYSYDIRLDSLSRPPIDKNDAFSVIINSQGSTSNRSLNLAWVHRFVEMLRTQVPAAQVRLLSATPQHAEQLTTHFKDLCPQVEVIPWMPSIGNALQEIANSDVLISPDTYAVHAASAWNIPVLALYEASSKTRNIWAPLSDSFLQVTAPTGFTVNDIPAEEAMKAFLSLLQNSPHEIN